MKKLQQVRKDILDDIAAMDVLKNKIMNSFRELKYNPATKQGILFFLREDFEKSYEHFQFKVKNFIDETYRRWQENFAASKGSSEAIENGIKLG